MGNGRRVKFLTDINGVGRSPCACLSLFCILWWPPRRLGWHIIGMTQEEWGIGPYALLGTLIIGSWTSLRLFFSRLTGNLVRKGDNDKVVWKDDKRGLFSIKSFYEVLDVGRVIIFPKNIIWNLLVPPEVSFFAWEAS